MGHRIRRSGLLLRKMRTMAISRFLLTGSVIAIVAAFVAAPVSAASAEASLSLKVETSAPTGKVLISLFNSDTSYSGGAPVAHAMIDVSAGETEAVFADLPAGDYAAKMFHDLDGDGRMNTNPFGMPTEPYAFTNNAHGHMGPATWEQTHVAVSGQVTQTINLR